MQRLIALALCCIAAACIDDPDHGDLAGDDTSRAALLGHAAGRQRLVGDVYHHRFEIPVGFGGERLVIHRVVRERAPWLPRATTDGVLIAHGDFTTFAANFAPVILDATAAPGMAVWLAQRGVDVWGYDRGWTQAPADTTDFSAFAAMGVQRQLADIRAALSFVRVVRLITGGNIDRLVLGGFSRGGQLAYLYAADEATRPPLQRMVKGIVPIDIYASLSPEDEELRLLTCESAASARAAVEAGELAFSNGFFSDLGQWALDAPDEASPYFPGRTNRGALYLFAGRTWRFFPATPVYHLAGPVLGADGITVTALRFSPEADVARWFAAAPPWQSWLESAETDALTCGDPPLPADLPLSRITVPVFYLGAAGGYGEHGLFSTTQVSSADVQTLIVRRLPVEDEQEDFGHGDLLYAPDAAMLAWQPLLGWLETH
jgi:hypothetical protein